MATVDFIRQLQPDVRQVFIVTGAAAADKDYEIAIRRQLPPSDSGLTFTYLSGLPTKELEDRLSKLPEHSAVYYVLVTEDGAGQTSSIRWSTSIELPRQRTHQPTAGWIPRWITASSVAASTARGMRLSASGNSPCACSAANRRTASRSTLLNLNA